MMSCKHITRDDIENLKSGVDLLCNIAYAKGSVFEITTPHKVFTLEFRSNNHRVNLYDSAGNKLFGTFLTKFDEKLEKWFEGVKR